MCCWADSGGWLAVGREAARQSTKVWKPNSTSSDSRVGIARYGDFCMKIKRSFIGISMALAALLLAACGGTSDPLGEASSPEPAQPSVSGAAAGPIVVGSADFTESRILAEIYSQALKAKGIDSST